MSTERELFDELSFYTLAHPDPSFIHQNAVDAYSAQSADENSKPIGILFALVGLYLHVERGFSGKQVQRIHMQLAQKRKQWPMSELPATRGVITVKDVVDAPAGPKRDAMIHAWCECAWKAWRASRSEIEQILKQELGMRWSSEVP